ncbi:MAG: type II toxin-antitoxin system HicA family toxin [Candidatus Bathyarchaeota archaeon]|nr:type II toxin-antitoxin system HicA family toxin [Candidatus Bathyarchaeota archaeon]
MPKIKPLPARKIIKVLEKTGFKVIRQKGSHVIMINEKGVRIVIPVHPGKDVKPGLIRAIIKEAGLKREEFFKLLKQT